MPLGGSELVLANRSPLYRLDSSSLGAWTGIGEVSAWIQAKKHVSVPPLPLV